MIGQFGPHLIGSVYALAPVCVQRIASVQGLVGEILGHRVGPRGVKDERIVKEGEVVVGARNVVGAHDAVVVA